MPELPSHLRRKKRGGSATRLSERASKTTYCRGRRGNKTGDVRANPKEDKDEGGGSNENTRSGWHHFAGDKQQNKAGTRGLGTLARGYHKTRRLERGGEEG